MPIYPYVCHKCELIWDVPKSLAEIDRPEMCEECSGDGERYIVKVNFNNAADWNPTFNPAFGQVVKSKAHQREILAKFKGEGREFIEVGNESLENIHKKFDTARVEKREKIWSESSEKIMGEVLK